MARSNHQPVSTATASALRKRVLGTRTRFDDAIEEPSAVLGSAHANAYFNAKRLKQASTRHASNLEVDDEEQPPAKEKTALGFVVQSMDETVELLRVVDAREDTWRRASQRHMWPTHDQSFPQWASQLHAGFSVLLHGVGSKFEVLQTFARTLPKTAYVVHIHGELPSVSLKDVMSLLYSEVFKLPTADVARLTPTAFLKQCRTLVDFAVAHRDQSYRHVYLVVHSLDGPALRDAQLQAGLARLAMAPTLHLVASIESVNAPSLWAEDDVQRFRWLHHRVDTLRPYARESDLRLSHQGKAAEQSISGVRYILQSLTPTDVGTLRLIAQLQLATSKPLKEMTTTTATTTTTKSTKSTKTRAATAARRANKEKYADYHAVYVASRKQLLHATMQSLKNSIKCLQDNGLVRLLRVRNTEKLTIPLADELLQSEIIGASSAAAITKK